MSNLSRAMYSTVQAAVATEFSKLQFDKTEIGTIQGIIDKEDNIYLVKILDSLYKIIAPDNAQYSEGDIVYIKVPNGDLSSENKVIDELKDSAKETTVSKIKLAGLEYINDTGSLKFVTGTTDENHSRIPYNSLVHYGEASGVGVDFWQTTYTTLTFGQSSLFNNKSFQQLVGLGNKGPRIRFVTPDIYDPEEYRNMVDISSNNHYAESLLQNINSTNQKLVFSFNQYFDYTLFKPDYKEIDVKDEKYETYSVQLLDEFMKSKFDVGERDYDYGFKFYFWPKVVGDITDPAPIEISFSVKDINGKTSNIIRKNVKDDISSSYKGPFSELVIDYPEGNYEGLTITAYCHISKDNPDWFQDTTADSQTIGPDKEKDYVYPVVGWIISNPQLKFQSSDDLEYLLKTNCEYDNNNQYWIIDAAVYSPDELISDSNNNKINLKLQELTLKNEPNINWKDYISVNAKDDGLGLTYSGYKNYEIDTSNLISDWKDIPNGDLTWSENGDKKCFINYPLASSVDSNKITENVKKIETYSRKVEEAIQEFKEGILSRGEQGAEKFFFYEGTIMYIAQFYNLQIKKNNQWFSWPACVEVNLYPNLSNDYTSILSEMWLELYNYYSNPDVYISYICFDNEKEGEVKSALNKFSGEFRELVQLIVTNCDLSASLTTAFSSSWTEYAEKFSRSYVDKTNAFEKNDKDEYNFLCDNEGNKIYWIAGSFKNERELLDDWRKKYFRVSLVQKNSEITQYSQPFIEENLVVTQPALKTEFLNNIISLTVGDTPIPLYNRDKSNGYIDVITQYIPILEFKCQDEILNRTVLDLENLSQDYLTYTYSTQSILSLYPLINNITVKLFKVITNFYLEEHLGHIFCNQLYDIKAMELYDEAEIEIKKQVIGESEKTPLSKDLLITGTTSFFYDQHFKLRNNDYKRDGTGNKYFSFLIPLSTICETELNNCKKEDYTNDDDYEAALRTIVESFVQVYYETTNISKILDSNIEDGFDFDLGLIKNLLPTKVIYKEEETDEGDLKRQYYYQISFEIKEEIETGLQGHDIFTIIYTENSGKYCTTVVLNYSNAFETNSQYNCNIGVDLRNFSQNWYTQSYENSLYIRYPIEIVNLSTEKNINDKVTKFEVEGFGCYPVITEVKKGDSLKETIPYVYIYEIGQKSEPIYFCLKAHLSSGGVLEVYQGVNVLDWSNALGDAIKSPFYQDINLPKRLCYDANGDLLFSPSSFEPKVLTLIPTAITDTENKEIIIGYDYTTPSYLDSKTISVEDVGNNKVKMNIGATKSSNNEIGFPSGFSQTGIGDNYAITGGNFNFYKKLSYGGIFPLSIEYTVYSCNNTEGGPEMTFHQTIICHSDLLLGDSIKKWEGNEVFTTDTANQLLSPSLVAGIKNNNNLFSGAVLGNNYTADGDTRNGIFGYKNGVETLVFDSEGNGKVKTFKSSLFEIEKNDHTVAAYIFPTFKDDEDMICILPANQLSGNYFYDIKRKEDKQIELILDDETKIKRQKEIQDSSPARSPEGYYEPAAAATTRFYLGKDKFIFQIGSSSLVINESIINKLNKLLK